MSEKELKAFLMTTSMYYGRQLPDVVIKMYVESLRELSTEQVKEAIYAYQRNPKARTMPLVADIIGYFKPDVTEREEASAIATEIHALARRKGTTWVELPTFIDGVPKFEGKDFTFYDNFGDALESYIGELGRACVKISGGWRSVCENFNNSDHSIVRAQLRDLIESTVKKAKAGTLDVPMALPNKRDNEQISEITNVIGQLAETKKLE